MTDSHFLLLREQKKNIKQNRTKNILRLVCTYLIGHQSSNCSANFMVWIGFAFGSKKNEQKSREDDNKYYLKKNIHLFYWFNKSLFLNWTPPTTTIFSSLALWDESKYLVGTGTSVSAPNMTACCSLTKATKGLSRKSTSPTRTLEASASLGSFFMNLFFSWTYAGWDFN